MSSSSPAVLVLATGGTIAGLAPDPGRSAHYQPAQLGVQQLVDAVPALAAAPLQAEQVAQLDSKDMGPEVWSRLAARIAVAMADDAVAGIVVTHGTDTLEETARLLSRLFGASAKPVVLTAAMRPANAPGADGPRNLADAVAVARAMAVTGGGVVVVMQGRVWEAAQVRKLHTQALDAFGAAEAAPWGSVDATGVVLGTRPLSTVPALQLDPARLPAQGWPRVEIVSSHVGADGRVVDLLVADGVQGLVVAGTGNGTVHLQLHAALQRAAAAGVEVRVGSRVGRGAVSGRHDAWPVAAEATPAQARVDLQLALLARRRGHADRTNV